MDKVYYDICLWNMFAALSKGYILSDDGSLWRLYYTLAAGKLLNTLIYHFIIQAYNYSL